MRACRSPSPEHSRGSDNKQLLRRRQLLLSPGSQPSKSSTSLSSRTKLSQRLTAPCGTRWRWGSRLCPLSGSPRKRALRTAACAVRACTCQLLISVTSRSFLWTIPPRKSVFNGLKAQGRFAKSSPVNPLSRPRSILKRRPLGGVTQVAGLSFLAPSSPQLQTKTNRPHF